jgi:AcrR family transcriptional regulator
VATTAAAIRLGRPPKVDDTGVATRERLLTAAANACVEHGFDGATVADIARRADVSAPAIYNHFGGKVELMVAAGHAALDRLRPAGTPTRLSAPQVVRTFLADEFAATRRLLVELHLAGQRHPDVAGLLASWHTGQAANWQPAGASTDDATVKTFFLFLLGLCQIDALEALSGSAPNVTAMAERVVAALFPEEKP